MNTPEPTPNPSIIFDGDDSLWYCGRYYEDAKGYLYGLAAQVTPDGEMPSREEFVRLFDQFDRTRVNQVRIKIKDRFPTSLGAFYEMWCKEHGLRCHKSTIQQAITVGYDIYETVFPTMPGARDMLEALSRSHDLYLYTCGDQTIQCKRVLDAGFDTFFKGIGIPERKTARPLVRFMLANNIKPKLTWVIGNSPKSDIAPALEVGVPASQCVLVQSYSWSADEAEIDAPIHVVQHLSEIAPLIQKEAVLV